eukprot:1138198-Pelagomonas_calceolata.AAC.11
MRLKCLATNEDLRQGIQLSKVLNYNPELHTCAVSSSTRARATNRVASLRHIIAADLHKYWGGRREWNPRPSADL